ncbi:MAG: YihY/virulence factor BrkB family protein [Chloroflexaceae bacterium]|nr:YihY/virulence factor BrkB family protein [Chloroflexaceae bacterium]
MRIFERRLPGLSSEMAYNAILALFPAIVAVLTAISAFTSSIQPNFVVLTAQLQELIPEEVWSLLLEFVQTITISQDRGLFSVSFIAAIWVFSGVISTAMNALDQIHQIPSADRRPFWKAKLISLLLTVGSIFLLIIASFLVLLGDLLVKLAVEQNWKEVLLIFWQFLEGLGLIAVLVSAIAALVQISVEPNYRQKPALKAEAYGKALLFNLALLLILSSALTYTETLIQKAEFNTAISGILLNVWRLLSWPLGLGIVAIAFAVIYRFGPSRWQKGTPILPGAILAALSWAGVSSLFRLYVTNFGNYNRVYGAVGAVIVLMLWLYLSSLIMLIGDQLNATVGQVIREREQERLNRLVATDLDSQPAPSQEA